MVYAVKGFGGANLPLDNPLQVPAHRYSGRVLASGKEAMRTTPKFERGRLLGDVVFVSGTTAIKGEDSEFSEDTRVQALGAIDVVEHLVAPSNISPDCSAFRFGYLRVYVRRPQDLEPVREMFISHFRTPRSISSKPTSAAPNSSLSLRVSEGHCLSSSLEFVAFRLYFGGLRKGLCYQNSKSFCQKLYKISGMITYFCNVKAFLQSYSIEER